MAVEGVGELRASVRRSCVAVEQGGEVRGPGYWSCGPTWPSRGSILRSYSRLVRQVEAMGPGRRSGLGSPSRTQDKQLVWPAERSVRRQVYRQGTVASQSRGGWRSTGRRSGPVERRGGGRVGLRKDEEGAVV